MTKTLTLFAVISLLLFQLAINYALDDRAQQLAADEQQLAMELKQ